MEIIKNPTPRQLRWFGIALGPFVALLGWLIGGRWGTQAGMAVWIVGGALAALYLVFPGLRRKIFVGWMYAVYPIGWTISHVILGLVFLGLIVPIGRLVRWTGHDPLNRRGPDQDSYWVKKEERAATDRYFRQF